MSRKPKQIELTDAELVRFPYTSLNESIVHDFIDRYRNSLYRDQYVIHKELVAQVGEFRAPRYMFAIIRRDPKYLYMTPYQSITDIGQIDSGDLNYRFNPKYQYMLSNHYWLYAFADRGKRYRLMDRFNQLIGFRIDESDAHYAIDSAVFIAIIRTWIRMAETKQWKPAHPFCTRSLFDELMEFVREIDIQFRKYGLQKCLVQYLDLVKHVVPIYLTSPRIRRQVLLDDVKALFQKSTRTIQNALNGLYKSFQHETLTIMPIITPAAYRAFCEQMEVPKTCLDIHELTTGYVRMTYGVYWERNLRYVISIHHPVREDWDVEVSHQVWDKRNDPVEFPDQEMDEVGAATVKHYIQLHPYIEKLNSRPVTLTVVKRNIANFIRYNQTVR